MSTARTELAPSPVAPASPPAASAPLSGVDRTVPQTHLPASIQSPVPIPTRAEWNAAGLSLLFHILLMLVLAALLIPIRPHSSGTSIDGAIGSEEGGDGELLDSIRIGGADLGAGADLEKSVGAVNAVPAVEGALSGGSGSGKGAGSFNAAAALGSGSGGGGGGRGVGFFGTRSRADSVVFIVDMSGSMNDEHRFDRATQELIRSLNALEPSQKFFIFFYNGLTRPLFDQKVNKLLPATPATRAKAVKWIKTIRPDGDTFPEDAIERALKMKPQVVFFLTDGEIPDTTRDTAKRYNADHKTVIHTIAFVYEGGTEILRGIAADNKGKFRFVR